MREGNCAGNKINLLILSPVYYPHHAGGAEISTQMIAEGLEKDAAFSVEIMTHGDHCSTSDYVNGVKVHRHYFPYASDSMFALIHHKKETKYVKLRAKYADIFRIRKRAALYQKIFENYDLVMLSGNGIKMGCRDMWYAARAAKVPFVQIIRDPKFLYLVGNQPFRCSIVDKIYRKVNTAGIEHVPYVASPTQWMLEQHKKMGIHFCKEKVIPNMVRMDDCASLPFAEKQNVILYVGLLSKTKGVHTLIKTFQNLAQQLPSYQLVLIGRTADVEIPEDSRIIVKGQLPLKEVYKQMQQVKMVVLPSEWDEAFGRVIVEAVFNGTLAIGSNRGGIPELFGEHDRYIFEAGNNEALSEAIMQVANYDEASYMSELKLLQEKMRACTEEENIRLWKQFLLQIVSERE